jgi:hypothetical protein
MAQNPPSAALLRHYENKRSAPPEPEPERTIFHWGVKGMRWGVRKDRSPVEVTTSSKPGGRVKAKGGQNQPASEDAVKAAQAHRIARKSTTDALSNKELQALVNRMNLEQQYNQLNSNGPRASAGRKFASEFLQNGGKDISINAIQEGAKGATNLVPGVKAARMGIGIGAAIAEAYVRKYAGKKK